jgi:hypothetical protein
VYGERDRDDYDQRNGLMNDLDLPLPPRLPCGQCDEGQTRRAVCRRTRATAANGRLHAAAQGIRVADLEGEEGGSQRRDCDR